jgi:PTHB1 N-terminus
MTRTDNIAHGVKLGTFAKKKGLLVTINEEGYLDIIYLGVDVPNLQFQNAQTRDQSYEDLKKESAKLRCSLS